jgi:hypothetical protein
VKDTNPNPKFEILNQSWNAADGIMTVQTAQPVTTLEKVKAHFDSARIFKKKRACCVAPRGVSGGVT